MGSIIILLIAFFGTLAFVVFVLPRLVARNRNLRKIQKDCSGTECIITGYTTENDLENIVWYHPVVEYIIDGKRYKTTIDEPDKEIPVIGTRKDIFFTPGNPHYVQFDVPGSRDKNSQFLFIGLIFIIAVDLLVCYLVFAKKIG